MSLAQQQALTFCTCRPLCCTLWIGFALTGDLKAAMVRAGMGVLDYVRIRRAEGELASTEDTVEIHHDQLD